MSKDKLTKTWLELDLGGTAQEPTVVMTIQLEVPVKNLPSFLVASQDPDQPPLFNEFGEKPK